MYAIRSYYGACLAFKGVEGSIVMMHGSQGCSTYIRRHMAQHYNEPIDIASSALNEKATVYGGEANLKRGRITSYNVCYTKLLRWIL